MFRPTPRAFVLLLGFLLVLAPGRLAAALVWTPEGGWKVEGPSVLTNLVGEDARRALDSMNKARAQEEKGNRLSALRSYKRVTKNYPNSVYAPEAWYRTAKIRLSRKQYYKAFQAYQEILSRHPNTERFNEIIDEQYAIAEKLMGGARNRIWGVIPSFKNRERAVEYYEQVVANAPYGDRAPNAMMSIARGHQRLRNTEEAIDALDRMINFYPQSLLTPEAYLKLAQTHASLVEGFWYDQASTREAITYFEDFMILFPNDQGVVPAEKGLADMRQVLAESKMRLADWYFKYRSNYPAARVFYNEAITSYPDSEIARRARSRLEEVDRREAADKARGEGKGKRFWIF